MPAGSVKRFFLLLAVFWAAPSLRAQPFDPAGCSSRYKKSYEAPYGLTRADWDWQCRTMLSTDILAVAQEKCRERYDRQEAPAIGLTDKDWSRACEQALSGLSPEEYLRMKRVAFIMSQPEEQLTLAQTARFIIDAADATALPVRAKRERLQKRLARAHAALKRFGLHLAQSAWMSQPLGIDKASSMNAFYLLSAHFDGADRKNTVDWPVIKSSFLSDHAPFEVQTPAQIKAQLLQQVDSLSTVYDASILALMREAVHAVPVDSGRPPHTDLIALADARRAIEAVASNHTIIQWDPASPNFAITTTAKDQNGQLLRNADYTVRYKIIIRPIEAISKERFSIECLAATFLHEAGHVHVRSHGGGNNVYPKTNEYANETYAWMMEYRYYSNKMQELNEKIQALEEDLQSSGTPLAPSQIETDRKAIDALKEKRGHLLPDGEMDIFHKFQDSSADFRADLISRYYGADPKKEIQAGQVTLDQQKQSARQDKDEEKLAQLAVDERFDQEARHLNDEWRSAKHAECEALKKSDPSIQNMRLKYDELSMRLAAPKLNEAKKNRIMVEMLMESPLTWEYAACRIR